jgi:hypothetical protein
MTLMVSFRHYRFVSDAFLNPERRKKYGTTINEKNV